MIQRVRHFLLALLFTAVSCSAFQSVQAQSVLERFQASLPGVIPAVFEFDDQGQVIGVLEDQMVYRIFLPSGYDPAIEYPLILFMHGSGESGSDNVSQLGCFLETMILETDVNRPAILIFPQLAQSTGWSPDNPTDRTDEILELVLNDYSVDTDRMYLTGLSMGGFGATEYLRYYHQEFPGIYRFAAAAITAAAFVPDSAADTLSETPIWFSHGANDTTVNPSFSISGFNAVVGRPVNTPFMPDTDLILAGAPTDQEGIHRLTIYPNRPHSTWEQFYNSSLDVFDWLFAQSLPTVLGDFNADGVVDLADLDQYNGNIGAAATGALAALDLNNDGVVGADDFTQHYETLVETSNGLSGTLAGDLNLDGTVDVLGDAFALVSNLGGAATSWAQGDINGDGAVDVLGDAFALIGNLGRSND